MTNNIHTIEHRATGDFADKVRGFLADAEVPEHVSLTVTLYSGVAYFEVTTWRAPVCARCGQTLNTEELPGPFTVFDQVGDRDGEYDFQHGCGGHNYPADALVKVGEDTDLDAALEGIIASVESERESHLSSLRDEWTARGEKELASVRAELDGITDPEERAEFLAEHDAPSGEDISVIWNAADEAFYAEVYAPTFEENPVPELVS
ncbi:hypothetical protein [Mycobacteroides abscessus]|uniref:hypothetical protein n=1 Tax=Mycobacteroides abscessus TaxID=36809 RepID=UPI0005E96F00|nr:hypothetical protein [Mycobacteroides abscessus]CPW94797.1 Uncharacterised protein [Mycobacteroides abscessus]